MVTVVVVVASEVPSSAVGLDIIMMVVGVDCRLSFVDCRLSFFVSFLDSNVVLILFFESCTSRIR